MASAKGRNHRARPRRADERTRRLRLPSQKFGANATWLRLNVILYNLLSADKRVGLPEEFHSARPKRLRFLLLNTLATGQALNSGRKRNSLIRAKISLIAQFNSL
jgi:hypothetical protein